MSEPQASEQHATITNSNVGMAGDHSHIEGGIHYHQQGQQVDTQTNVAGNLVINRPPFERLSAWGKAHPRRFARASLATLLLLMFISTALVGTVSPKIRQALFLHGFWPRAFPAERDGEVLIVVANFYYSDNLANSEAHEEISHAIEQARDEVDFANLRVEVAPIRLRAEDRESAVALARRYNSSLVIWGADTGVRIAVNFYNHKQPNFDAAAVQIDETVRTQIATPSEYATFITQDLPAQLTFLSLFAVGQSYFATADYPASARVIEAAVARLRDASPPEGADEAYYSLGWLYSLPLPNPSLALANFTRALELDPNNACTYNNRGITYRRLGQYTQALADFSRALSLNPDLAIVYTNRGNTYHALGEYDQALTAHTRALELDPDFAYAYTNRGITYYSLNEYTLALADYTRALDLNPNDTLACTNRASTYYALGKYEQALNDYTRTLDLNPDFALAHHGRGLAYAALGKYAQALDDFTHALELAPDYAIAYTNRGNTYHTLNEYSLALADYTRAIEFDPDSAETYYNRGTTYFSLGEYGQALSDYIRALELDPDYAEAYGNRGNTYYALGQYTQALADYTSVLELDPTDVRAHYFGACAHAALGNVAEACIWLGNALTLAPAHTQARTDPAFDPIRDEPCFQALMDGTP